LLAIYLRMINLTIDGKKVKAKKGETVLEVALRNGIYLPTLCYHKELTPYGGCRLCLVEVRGWSGPIASCTLPAKDGMVVKTDTPELKKLRKFSLQLILSEHPHACLICERKEECAQYQECIQKTPITFGCKFCPRNGDCELQKLIEYFDIKEIPFEFAYRNLDVEKFDPFFERDYNICILCGRCVRVCREVRGVGTLDFHYRGPNTIVGTAFGLPHLETGCQFCGACVDVCPTGALRERYGKWKGLPDRSVKTTCVLCSIGCAIKVNVSKDGMTSSVPDNNQICVRGRFGIAPLVHNSKRVTAPMLKKENRVVEVDWAEVLKNTALKLSDHRGKTGIIYSPQLTIEAINKIYTLADFLNCVHLSTVSALPEKVEPLSLKKIKGQVAFIIINTDVISDFSPLFLRLTSQLRMKPIIIAIDAFDTNLTQIADLRLTPRPGKEDEVLQLVLDKKRTNTTGISVRDIDLGKDMLRGRDVYLVYNPFNCQDINVPKTIKTIQVNGNINALKIFEMGVDCSAQSLLQNKNIECLYLIGVVPKFIEKYKTVIVQDCFLPRFEFDLFLPTATFAETNGSVINIEGKKRRLRRVIEPLGKARPDDWIVKEIGRLLKCSMSDYRPKKRKRMISNYFKNAKLSKKYPFHLTVRENCYSYRSYSLSELMRGFERLRGDNHVWINSSTAETLGIKDGAHIRIIGKDMKFESSARLTDDMPEYNLLVYYLPSMGIVRNGAVRVECIKK